MKFIKKIVGALAVAWIAAVVAYSVSAPRNVEDLMHEPNPGLGGQSLNQQMAASQAKVRSEQCAEVTRLAESARNTAIDRETTDQDAARLDELDRLAEEYCRP